MPPATRFSLIYYLLVFAGMYALQSYFFSGIDVPEIAYSEFRSEVEGGKVAEVVLTGQHIIGRRKPENPAEAQPTQELETPTAKAPWHLDRILGLWRGLRTSVKQEQQAREAAGKLLFTVLPLNDPELLELLQSHGVEYRGKVESHWLSDLLSNWIVPFGVMFLLWGFLMRRMGKGPSALQIGKSRAKIYEADPDNRVHFSDLAGVDEAIEETREIVRFLKEPTQFTRLGAKLPKGVLLVGPPGTGKTLLARAVAGESAVPFFSLSGSDFVEMFVGVGAARVRDLFEEAEKSAPCIIFIDELDAIGKSRAQGSTFLGGGYDERENTLNQLLVEMDGFDASSGVVILAATNRPEVLDPALLRPGRFDRRVVVDRPTSSGRKAIFRIHTRNLPLDADVDFEALAVQTPGMVGSDIANVCNESALLATRAGREKVSMSDFQEAIERAIAGTQRRSLVVAPEERVRIAYHEAGHALVGHLTPGGNPVQKISIIPRSSGAMGYTIQMPLEDRFVLSKVELMDRIRVLLAGRAAEEVVIGDISTGASDDLEKANQIAREMLTTYGMSETVPNLTLAGRGAGGYLGGVERLPFSEHIAESLDAECLAILARCYEDDRNLLEERREMLETLAQRLLNEEELDHATVVAILGEQN